MRDDEKAKGAAFGIYHKVPTNFRNENARETEERIGPSVIREPFLKKSRAGRSTKIRYLFDFLTLSPNKPPTNSFFCSS
jgi:hypothetical protein